MNTQLLDIVTELQLGAKAGDLGRQEIEEAIVQAFKLGKSESESKLGLLEIELEHNKRLLNSCEKALESRDNQYYGDAISIPATTQDMVEHARNMDFR